MELSPADLTAVSAPLASRPSGSRPRCSCRMTAAGGHTAV